MKADLMSKFKFNWSIDASHNQGRHSHFCL